MLARMAHLALSAVGRDRPGIVAAVSGALVGWEANIEDSHMAILQGHFTMTLVVAAADDLNVDDLRAELARIADDLDLESISVASIDELADEARPVATHAITVYGVDHPGIVHAVSVTLAAREITICDLRTRLAGDDPPLYAMTLEVQAPAEVADDELAALLADVGRDQDVEVSVRPVFVDAL